MCNLDTEISSCSIILGNVYLYYSVPVSNIMKNNLQTFTIVPITWRTLQLSVFFLQHCKCSDELKRHKRSSSFCTGDENVFVAKEVSFLYSSSFV